MFFKQADRQIRQVCQRSPALVREHDRYQPVVFGAAFAMITAQFFQRLKQHSFFFGLRQRILRKLQKFFVFTGVPQLAVRRSCRFL